MSNAYDPSKINFDQVAIDGKTVTVNSPSLLKAFVKAPIDTLNYFSLSLKNIDIDEHGYIIINDESLAKNPEIIAFSKHGGSTPANHYAQFDQTNNNYMCAVINGTCR
jgi:hypothetical protein